MLGRLANHYLVRCHVISTSKKVFMAFSFLGLQRESETGMNIQKADIMDLISYSKTLPRSFARAKNEAADHNHRKHTVYAESAKKTHPETIKQSFTLPKSSRLSVRAWWCVSISFDSPTSGKGC